MKILRTINIETEKSRNNQTHTRYYFPTERDKASREAVIETLTEGDGSERQEMTRTLVLFLDNQLSLPQLASQHEARRWRCLGGWGGRETVRRQRKTVRGVAMWARLVFFNLAISAGDGYNRTTRELVLFLDNQLSPPQLASQHEARRWRCLGEWGGRETVRRQRKTVRGVAMWARLVFFILAILAKDVSSRTR